MSTPFRSRPALALSLALLFCCAGAAQAQFVWIGPNGNRVYSDQPPPPGTPAAKILKAPGRAAPPQEAAPVPDKDKPKAPTLAERETDFRKRAQARDEQEKKTLEEARRNTAKAEYCDGVSANLRLYQSGVRVTGVDARGEKTYLSDSERSAAVERMTQQLGDCR